MAFDWRFLLLVALVVLAGCGAPPPAEPVDPAAQYGFTFLSPERTEPERTEPERTEPERTEPEPDVPTNPYGSQPATRDHASAAVATQLRAARSRQAAREAKKSPGPCEYKGVHDEARYAACSQAVQLWEVRQAAKAARDAAAARDARAKTPCGQLESELATEQKACNSICDERGSAAYARAERLIPPHCRLPHLGRGAYNSTCFWRYTEKASDTVTKPCRARCERKRYRDRDAGWDAIARENGMGWHYCTGSMPKAG